jgi:hypothetical protein
MKSAANHSKTLPPLPNFRAPRNTCELKDPNNLQIDSIAAAACEIDAIE